MYDPKVKDLGLDAFGDPHPVRGFWLVDALERWAADQPDGRRATAREISQEVARYRKFQSPATHGPGRCARIVATDPRWYRRGAWLIKGARPTITPPGAVVSWLNSPGAPARAQAIDYARQYSDYAAGHNWPAINARGMVPHLRAAGYTIVARPNNRAIYERTNWI